MRARNAPLAALLLLTMSAATFQMFALGILASPIIDDLELSRFMLGATGAVNTLVGAVTAPFTGGWADRIGPRRGVIAVLALSAVGMAILGMADNIPLLLLSGAVSGLAQGLGNPATNLLIAETVEPGRQGTLTGIKQSGVTAAAVMAGATLPWLEGFGDWQTASLVYAVVFTVIGAVAAILLPRPAHVRHEVVSTPIGGVLSPLVVRLTAFAFLMGLSGGGIGRFLALFAEEEIGVSHATAGAAVALSGLLGVFARIYAGRTAERSRRPIRLLTILAVIAVGNSGALVLSTELGVWMLWVTVVMYALGHTPWNAVINLAVIVRYKRADAGRITGVIYLGFLLGLAAGSPITGWIVDTYDTYTPAWILAAVLAAAAAAVSAGIGRDGLDGT